MNSHDILIALLILIIVAIQVLVFLSVFRRIRLFRKIIPNAQIFRTVSVYVPIEQIAHITPEEILNNLQKYSDKTSVETDAVIQSPHGEELLLSTDNVDWDEEATEIWMYKGNEEIKVPVHLMSDYEAKGWEKFIAPNDDE